MPSVVKIAMPVVGVARLGSTGPTYQTGPCQVVDCPADDGPVDPVRQVLVVWVGAVERAGPYQAVQGGVLNSPIPPATMGTMQVGWGVPSDASSPRPLCLVL
jgi:hypothetical protein